MYNSDIYNSEIYDIYEIKKSKKKGRYLLIMFVLFIYTVSLCFTSYLIGKTAKLGSLSGLAIDTIILSSTRKQISTVPLTTTVLSINGKVTYTDGSPYPNGTVELQSTPRYTTTDNGGGFKFDNVEQGSHTISIIENGKAIATCVIQVQQSSQTSDVQTIRMPDGSYLVEIPVTISSIQIELSLNRDNKTLTISRTQPRTENPGDTTTPNSSSSPAPSGGSSGNNTPNPSASGSPGSSSTPSPSNNPNGTPSPSQSPSSTPSTNTTPPSDTTKPSTTPTGKPTSTPSHTLPPIPPWNGSGTTNEVDDASSWVQATAVDIFAARPGNTGVSTINGEKVIAPGAIGSYAFRLSNINSFDILYSIKLAESDTNDPKLPMKYRLLKGVSGSDYVGGSGWKTASEILLDSSTITKGASDYYTLEWKWDTSSNSTDTAIGTQSGAHSYMINIVINIESK